LRKCTVTRIGVVVGAYYVDPNNVHVKNEKLYASTWQDTIVDLIEKARKTKKKCNSLQYFAQAKTSNDGF
jgi:hypothetical protein